MRVRSLSILLLICAVALAGCAEGEAPPAAEDPALEDLDLKAGKDTGVIRGIVVDASITPVAGVTVTIQSTGDSTETNEKGAFGFSDLEPGSHFLSAEKPGYASVQTSANVVAGVDEPPVLKVLMERVPGSEPYLEDLYMAGYLTCGVAVFATSVGCTTIPAFASLIGDQSVFPVDYTKVPAWIQSELVWDQTQPAGGMFIWEITPQGSNSHVGYRETTTSPALAYLDNATTAAEAGTILDTGLNFRFFGGPHPLCHGVYGFGCGVTLEQEAEVFVHQFYNFLPAEGWRFTSEGSHPVPT